MNQSKRNVYLFDIKLKTSRLNTKVKTKPRVRQVGWALDLKVFVPGSTGCSLPNLNLAVCTLKKISRPAIYPIMDSLIANND